MDNRIVRLERITAGHWRGTEEEPLGEWRLRAAGGFTGRANSALPLGDPGLPLDDAVDAVARWYRARGLPPMIALPAPLADDAPARPLDTLLSERTWATRPGPAFVMTADLPLTVGLLGDLPARAAFRTDPEPDEAWLEMYHYRGTTRRSPALRAVLTSAPAQEFASIRTGRRPGGDVLAIARLSFGGGWAGLTAVEVRPDQRRAGLGTAITAAACGVAVTRGVRNVFLQVEEGNTAARSLYQRCGFRYAHRYRYRVAPPLI